MLLHPFRSQKSKEDQSTRTRSLKDNSSGKGSALLTRPPANVVSDERLECLPFSNFAPLVQLVASLRNTRIHCTRASGDGNLEFCTSADPRRAARFGSLNLKRFSAHKSSWSALHTVRCLPHKYRRGLGCCRLNVCSSSEALLDEVIKC